MAGKRKAKPVVQTARQTFPTEKRARLIAAMLGSTAEQIREISLTDALYASADPIFEGAGAVRFRRGPPGDEVDEGDAMDKVRRAVDGDEIEESDDDAVAPDTAANSDDDDDDDAADSLEAAKASGAEVDWVMGRMFAALPEDSAAVEIADLVEQADEERERQELPSGDQVREPYVTFISTMFETLHSNGNTPAQRTAEGMRTAIRDDIANTTARETTAWTMEMLNSEMHIFEALQQLVITYADESGARDDTGLPIIGRWLADLLQNDDTREILTATLSSPEADGPLRATPRSFGAGTSKAPTFGLPWGRHHILEMLRAWVQADPHQRPCVLQELCLAAYPTQPGSTIDTASSNQPRILREAVSPENLEAGTRPARHMPCYLCQAIISEVLRKLFGMHNAEPSFAVHSHTVAVGDGPDEFDPSECLPLGHGVYGPVLAYSVMRLVASQCKVRYTQDFKRAPTAGAETWGEADAEADEAGAPAPKFLTQMIHCYELGTPPRQSFSSRLSNREMPFPLADAAERDAGPVPPMVMGGVAGENYLGMPALEPIVTITVDSNSPPLRRVFRRREFHFAEVLRRELPAKYPRPWMGCAREYELLFVDDFEATVRAVADGRLADAVRRAAETDGAVIVRDFGFRQIYPETDALAWACILRLLAAHAFLVCVPEKSALRVVLQLFIDQHIPLTDYLIRRREADPDAGASEGSAEYLSVRPEWDRWVFWVGQLPDLRALMAYHSEMWYTRGTGTATIGQALVYLLFNKVYAHPCQQRALDSILKRITGLYPAIMWLVKDIITVVLLGNYRSAKNPPNFMARSFLMANCCAMATMSHANFWAWVKRNTKVVKLCFRIFMAETLRRATIPYIFERTFRRFDDLAEIGYNTMDVIHAKLSDRAGVLAEAIPTELFGQHNAALRAVARSEFDRMYARVLQMSAELTQEMSAEVVAADKQYGYNSFITRLPKGTFPSKCDELLRRYLRWVEAILDGGKRAESDEDALAISRRRIDLARRISESLEGVPQRCWPPELAHIAMVLPSMQHPGHIKFLQPANALGPYEHPLLTPTEMEILHKAAHVAAGNSCNFFPLTLISAIGGIERSWLIAVFCIYVAADVFSAAEGAPIRNLPSLFEWDPRAFCALQVFTAQYVRLSTAVAYPLSAETARYQIEAVRRRWGIRPGVPTPPNLFCMPFCGCGRLQSAVVTPANAARTYFNFGASAAAQPVFDMSKLYPHCGANRTFDCDRPLLQMNLLGRRGRFYTNREVVICARCGVFTTLSTARISTRGPYCGCELEPPPLDLKPRALPGMLAQTPAGMLYAQSVSRTDPEPSVTTVCGTCAICPQQLDARNPTYSNGNTVRYTFDERRKPEVCAEMFCEKHFFYTTGYFNSAKLPPDSVVSRAVLIEYVRAAMKAASAVSGGMRTTANAQFASAVRKKDTAWMFGRQK